jgi:uncharacterized protein (DUF983 family)
MKNETPHRGYLSTVFSCRCPRCREGELFVHGTSISLKKNMQMHERCPVCGQPTDIEVGFYYGTGYVSYAIALIISGITFVAWFLIFGFSFKDNRFLYWVLTNAVILIALQPWLMRVARSLWLSWFVKYDPKWREHDVQENERVIKEHMNNW